MTTKVELHQFSGVYWVTMDDGSRQLATQNLASGVRVYGEPLMVSQSKEYRLWNPYRSKLAAAILKGLQKFPIKPDDKVLYLGAASGTTASHISDIVGKNGHVYCVEFAPRAMRDLVNNVCVTRTNMSPILADARLPEHYSMIMSSVDEIYCDVAQPEQTRISMENADLFLDKGGWVIQVIKARSIDVTREPNEIFRREIIILENHKFSVGNIISLEPYDKAHAMVVARKK